MAVMLTPAATRFVGPLSFAALSRHPVETELLELMDDGRIGHIVVGDTADAIVVAPATAHWLGAMANGLAGDVVTATCLASSAPVVVAPAMDGDMWTHPATVANVASLRGFGYSIVEPDSGPLASGQSGVGRLAELPAIVDAVVAAVADRPVRAPDPAARPPIVAPARDADLTGRHIVVSAGGTREAIDPVRFIGNRSTGRMGAAIAEAALDRGARVTIIAANIEVPPPAGAAVVEVVSTADLDARPAGDDPLARWIGRLRRPGHGCRRRRFPAGRARRGEAVAGRGADPRARVDARPARGDRADRPRARPRRGAHRRRAPTDPDPRRRSRPRPGRSTRAAEKLRSKHVDLLVANDVTEAGSGFGTDTNRVSIFAADGSRENLPLLAKRAVADELLDRVARLLDERDAAAQTERTIEPERERA